MRDHGVDKRPVEGVLVGEGQRVHHHAHGPHLLGAHLHRHLRSAEFLLLDGFEFLYLVLLDRNDVPGEFDYLIVLGVLECYLGHGYGALVVGNHRVDEPLVRVLAVVHNHLPGHPTGTHFHRAVAHLIVVHTAILGHVMPAVTARPATLLSTVGAPASGQDDPLSLWWSAQISPASASPERGFAQSLNTWRTRDVGARAGRNAAGARIEVGALREPSCVFVHVPVLS